MFRVLRGLGRGWRGVVLLRERFGLLCGPLLLLLPILVFSFDLRVWGENEGEGRLTFGSETTFVTHREAVWNGAWGISPFGKGIPRRPATPVVRPRRKMSQ